MIETVMQLSQLYIHLLKRLKEAGLTMLLIWPPFQDVPVSKTLDDLKRLKEEIMPKVEAT